MMRGARRLTPRAGKHAENIMSASSAKTCLRNRPQLTRTSLAAYFLLVGYAVGIAIIRKSKRGEVRKMPNELSAAEVRAAYSVLYAIRGALEDTRGLNIHEAALCIAYVMHDSSFPKADARALQLIVRAALHTDPDLARNLLRETAEIIEGETLKGVEVI